MAPPTSVTVHISWDFSFPDFNEVSVLYSGLQIRNIFSFIEYMSVSKVPDVETRVSCPQTDVSPCLATAVTTDRKTTAGLHGHHSFAFSRLTYVRVSKPHIRRLGVACLAPCICISPRSLRCSSSVGVQDQDTRTGTYSIPICSTRMTQRHL